MKLLGCLVLLSLLSGCLFDSGSSTLAVGTVRNGALCSSQPTTGGCPACSTPDGAFCRGDWYSNALRCSGDAQCGGAPGACQLGYCVLKDADSDG
ncbi:MAG: hypothetical protein JWM53_7082, partial [bacterium]|nr:hypothetical protein [bacterium]